MEQRGRKSAAALGVIAIGPKARLDPPPMLTEDQAKVWRAAVASKPADWFAGDTIPLLVDYCRLATDADAIEVAMQAMGAPQGPEDVEMYGKLVRLRCSVAGAKAQLATKMRLAQQSMYEQSKAHVATKHALAGTMPWQRQKVGGES